MASSNDPIINRQAFDSGWGRISPISPTEISYTYVYEISISFLCFHIYLIICITVTINCVLFSDVLQCPKFIFLNYLHIVKSILQFLSPWELLVNFSRATLGADYVLGIKLVASLCIGKPGLSRTTNVSGIRSISFLISLSYHNVQASNLTVHHTTHCINIFKISCAMRSQIYIRVV